MKLYQSQIYGASHMKDQILESLSHGQFSGDDKTRLELSGLNKLLSIIEMNTQEGYIWMSDNIYRVKVQLGKSVGSINRYALGDQIIIDEWHLQLIQDQSKSHYIEVQFKVTKMRILCHKINNDIQTYSQHYFQLDNIEDDQQIKQFLNKMKKDLIKLNFKQNYFSYLNCQLPLDLFVFSQSKMQQFYQFKQNTIIERNKEMLSKLNNNDKVYLVLQSNNYQNPENDIFQRVQFTTPSVTVSQSYQATPFTTHKNSPVKVTTGNFPATTTTSANNNVFNFSKLNANQSNLYTTRGIASLNNGKNNELNENEGYDNNLQINQKTTNVPEKQYFNQDPLLFPQYLEQQGSYQEQQHLSHKQQQQPKHYDQEYQQQEQQFYYQQQQQKYHQQQQQNQKHNQYYNGQHQRYQNNNQDYYQNNYNYSKQEEGQQQFQEPRVKKEAYSQRQNSNYPTINSKMQNIHQQRSFVEDKNRVYAIKQKMKSRSPHPSYILVSGSSSGEEQMEEIDRADERYRNYQSYQYEDQNNRRVYNYPRKIRQKQEENM